VVFVVCGNCESVPEELWVSSPTDMENVYSAQNTCSSLTFKTLTTHRSSTLLAVWATNTRRQLSESTRNQSRVNCGTLTSTRSGGNGRRQASRSSAEAKDQTRKANARSTSNGVWGS
jgi:hypothetical protein